MYCLKLPSPERHCVVCVCVCVCVCDEIVLLVDLTVIPCAQYFQRCFVVVPPRPCLFAVIPKL